ncbi:MAG TPA: phosphodiester glycosidase family protein [Candidatus Limnocylindria bacterium]|nr:phosphodiester glycosidase family protein [Candidatus Limnocylindria bacterium]
MGIVARSLSVLLAAAALLAGPAPAAAQTGCVASVGPGIPPPASVPAGIPGFHAHWYGQSGYPTLCPGQRSAATVAYYNSGSLGWVAGRMGEVAYLGTWGPEPGQDRASILGGDGAWGSPNTGWPRYDRIAMQPAPYVGPGQVAWFQFSILAPATPGHYRLYLRPLIEGATWMEDFGVFWNVVVLNPDGSRPPAPPPPPAVESPLGYSSLAVPTPVGTFNVHLIKERLSDVTVRTVTANAVDCRDACPVKPLAQYVAENGAYAGMNGTYLCPPDYSWCAGKVNTYDYAVYNSNLGRWLNSYALISVNALVTFTGTAPRFYRRAETFGRSPYPVTAGISNFPLLLSAGTIVDSEAEQTAVQKTRGTKGSIGSDGTHVFLALVASASVTESAYVLRGLGVHDAMNLDGGGTAAMHFGGAYRVGPGRQLPNAVLLMRR